MTFFKSHQKLHIWLLADLVLLAAFWIAREHRDWMNALERFVSAPIRRSLGSLCYRVSFSVMEVLYVLAAVLVLAYVVWNITAVVRARGRRKRRAYSAVLGAVCAGLSVCAATCLLCKQSAKRTHAITASALRQAPDYLAPEFFLTGML